MRREEYHLIVQCLADSAVTETLALYGKRSPTEAVPDLMQISEYEITANMAVLRYLPLCRPRNWEAFLEHTYHKPLLGLLDDKQLTQVVRCAVLQDVIRHIERKLATLLAENMSLNFTPEKLRWTIHRPDPALP